MKFFTVIKVVQYYLPVTLSLFMWVTIERKVITDGGYDRLYGLPLPCISGNYACTGCYDVFLPTLFFNLLFWFGLTLALFKVLHKMDLLLKTYWAFVILGALVSLFWIKLFFLITNDSRFLFKVDTDYKTESSKLVFGLKP